MGCQSSCYCSSVRASGPAHQGRGCIKARVSEVFNTSTKRNPCIGLGLDTRLGRGSGWKNFGRLDFHSSLDGCRAVILIYSFSLCQIAHGADVLLVTSPKLPDLPFLDKDTSRGKRTSQLNFLDRPDQARLLELVEGADVFLQAYRPDGLLDKGFGLEDLVRARPGLVYAGLRAYGWEGPWKDRRGV